MSEHMVRAHGEMFVNLTHRSPHMH